MDSQLWIQTDQGTKKGIFALTLEPEVSVLTWGLGPSNGIFYTKFLIIFLGSVPDSFDDAMIDNDVFVLAKCLNPQYCKWKPIPTLLKNPEVINLINRATKRFYCITYITHIILL